MTEHHLYLYGFVAPAHAWGDDALPAGVADAGVERVQVGSLEAVVSRVPSDRFDAAALEEAIHDLEWVKALGAAHEAVVTWHVDRGDILPARLLTLYSDESALRDAVAERGDELADELRDLAGLREWDLKVTYDAAHLRRELGRVSDAVASMDAELAEAGPGRRFLLEKKRDKLVRSETTRTARALAREALEAAAGAAREHRVLAQPRSVEEGSPVALSAALLVPREAEDALRAALTPQAERLAELGMAVELSGPWAPYRFVSGDEEQA